MAQGARHLRGVWLGRGPLFCLQDWQISVRFLYSIGYRLLRVVHFGFSAVRFIMPPRSLCFVRYYIFARRCVSVFVLHGFVRGVFLYVFLPVPFFHSRLFKGNGDQRGEDVIGKMMLCFVRGLGHVTRDFEGVDGRFVRLFTHFRPFLFNMGRALQVVRIFAHARASGAIVYFYVYFLRGIGIIETGRLRVVFFEVFSRIAICVRLR